jgi:hypothetical protein
VQAKEAAVFRIVVVELVPGGDMARAPAHSRTPVKMVFMQH